ncbi:Pre-mRNA-splicing factor 38B [Echinococcus granulosus]|uniref:Pre-mRNA-splicing factor 38 n=1 Tax=Echinococcus granulosus TaxID=6210 RepID=U6J7B2_ECHGR|nr:Pre-mRNA-splicing factor 38B [Echinococcus granulosus]EUB62090.1 Pre-mRNA-splicing factor 38B [Echinococcus granulosus]KAH9285061.1 Pre-mRNA-splicing factor 38B [Echinococcus granulosus]CDS19981.1 pre mRNA splicing factor 38B [Echinococcus granulosus]
MATGGFPQEGSIQSDEEEEFKPRGNILKLWGNQVTMNINPMIHTNIIQSPYFKTNLIELKTYHEVIDEIYYKVTHLEPWERNSRRMGGQTGMCGGVRGVGAGGIVSTAYCLLFKLFTLKLTRKQLKGLLEHPDSPYIRALGFMYIRYCLPPEDLWMWFAPYLDDEEEIDVRAGGGCSMTIGAMLGQWLTKLDWFSTLFPRIPVPVQKKIDEKLRLRRQKQLREEAARGQRYNDRENRSDSEDRYSRDKKKYRDYDDEQAKCSSHSRSRSHDRHRHRRHRSRSRSHDRGRRETSFDRDLRRVRERQERIRR